MEEIKTFWLGIPTIERNGIVVNLETRKAVALLAYLSITFPSPFSREYLATLFWQEYDQQHANANLRRTLYSINSVLGPDFITGNREKVTINPSYQLLQDVSDFRQLLANVKSHHHQGNVCIECIGNLEKATALYRGSLLEGLNLRDSTEFDHWQYLERENYLLEFSSSLEKLALAYASIGEWEKAIQKARQWVSFDHLDENAQRTLIKLYTQAGQRSAALHQFEEYSRILKDELGQSPDEETISLFRDIQTGRMKKTESFSEINTTSNQGDLKKQSILKTKLFVPKFQIGLVKRNQLIRKLVRSKKSKLTLICAPAGYGKTTLLSEWIDSLQKSSEKSDWSICWLSLDPGDNDPARFLTYLTAALEKAHPRMITETQKLINSNEPHHPTIPLTTLINDLHEINHSVLIILDDYQFIDNQIIHDGITFLFENLPDNVHIIIATRSDPPFPLARLRVTNQLTEIRAVDLKFSTDETTFFLNQIFNLDLNPEQITILENRTEGWAAGLQLAGVSMQGRLDIQQFIDAFSGSHRFIMDYLAEEALNRLPLETQNFLLKTSILERLNDSLCDFLLTDGSENGYISSSYMESDRSYKQNQSRLKHLESSGLFIVPQDDERIWYRYHHLFADLLHTQLERISPELMQTLHKRASLWFEHNGFIEEAINHSLLTLEWENSYRLFDLHFQTYLDNGQMTTVMGWINAFPQDILHKNPKLCIQVAELYSKAGMIDQIDPLLNQAEGIISSKKNVEFDQINNLVFRLSPNELTMVKSMISILRGLKAVCSGKPQQAIDITQVGYESIPDMEPKELAILFWVQGWAHRSLGNLNLALDLLIRATDYARVSGAPLRDIWTDLGNVTRLVGKLDQAVEIMTNSLQLASESGIQNQGNLSRDEGFLSLFYYEQNQLELAYTYADRALRHTQWWPSHNIIATANVSLAQIMLARNDLNGSLNALKKAEEERKNRLMTPFVHSLIDVTWVQVWLKQGNWDLLDHWERKQVSILESRSMSDDHFDEYLEMRLIMLARVWIEKIKLSKKEERFESCFSVIERLEINSRKLGRGNSLVVVLLYKAIVLFHNEMRNEAYIELDNCFELAEPGEYMRIFLDVGESSRALVYAYLQQADVIHKNFALKILREFSNSQKEEKQKEAPPDVLTSRETDILQLLAEGCSNREIAERLVLSVGTIKFHIHNILGKLNVTSRTMAITKARELNLIRAYS